MVRDMLKMYFTLKVGKQQWYSSVRLRELQDRLLFQTIRRAFSFPFYRRMFEEQQIPARSSSARHILKKLPVITKKQVRDAFLEAAIYSRTPGLISRTTSGSSGFPLTVVYDRTSYAYSEAIYARALFEQGVRFTDRIAYFWYEPFRQRGWWEYCGLFRKREVLYTVSEEAQIKQLEQIRPTVIHAFPTLLVYLGKRLKYTKQTIRPRLIITHGELLTEEMRQSITGHFQAPVLDQYGSNEFNRMAWQCPQQDHYHVDADNILIELLDKDGQEVRDGERGRVVVTSLMNRAMPLLRYDIGDFAVKKDGLCPCGRGLPLLLSIEGRADDFIVTHNGRVLSPRRIGGLLEHFNTIKQYKFIQESADEFILLVVPAESFSLKDERELLGRLLEVLGSACTVQIKRVPAIPQGRTGKIKAIESKVKKDSAHV